MDMVAVVSFKHVQTCSKHVQSMGHHWADFLCLQWSGPGSQPLRWARSLNCWKWLATGLLAAWCRMLHPSWNMEQGKGRKMMNVYPGVLWILSFNPGPIQSHTITISNTRHTPGDMGRCHLSELEPAIVAMNPHRPWAAEDASHLQFQMVGKSCWNGVPGGPARRPQK